MKKIIIGPDLDERLKDGYYFMDANCSNCKDPSGIGRGSIDVMIPLGQPKSINKFICPNCNCRTLEIY